MTHWPGAHRGDAQKDWSGTRQRVPPRLGRHEGQDGAGPWPASRRETAPLSELSRNLFRKPRARGAGAAATASESQPGDPGRRQHREGGGRSPPSGRCVAPPNPTPRVGTRTRPSCWRRGRRSWTRTVAGRTRRQVRGGRLIAYGSKPVPGRWPSGVASRGRLRGPPGQGPEAARTRPRGEALFKDGRQAAQIGKRTRRSWAGMMHRLPTRREGTFAEGRVRNSGRGTPSAVSPSAKNAVVGARLAGQGRGRGAPRPRLVEVPAGGRRRSVRAPRHRPRRDGLSFGADMMGRELMEGGGPVRTGARSRGRPRHGGDSGR